MSEVAAQQGFNPLAIGERSYDDILLALDISTGAFQSPSDRGAFLPLTSATMLHTAFCFNPLAIGERSYLLSEKALNWITFGFNPLAIGERSYLTGALCHDPQDAVSIP